jgi:hypothetical protein
MDAQIYTISDFHSVKSNVVLRVPVFKAKLDSIIALPCFNAKEQQIPCKPVFSKKQVSARKKHSQYHQQHSQPQQTRKPLFAMEPINKVQGILNKMSHTKYESLASQVAEVFPQVPFEDFMTCVLEQAAKHTFTKEFVYTLYHVCQVHPSHQERVDEYLVSYIKSLQSNDLLKWNGVVEGESYDEFCERVKAKNMIIGRIRTLCELYDIFDLKQDIMEFVHWYIDFGDMLLSSSHIVENHIMIELYIESIALLVEKVSDVRQVFIASKNLDQWILKHASTLPKRIQFKLMDLAENLNQTPI